MEFKEKKMGFQYVDYDVLKEKILQSIQHLAKKYKHNAQKLIEDYKQDKADPNELAHRYANIPQKRRTQSGFILTTIRCLDASSISIEDRQQILNALACYVHGSIFNDYDPERSWINYFSSFATNENNSKFYVSLATSLDFRVDNIPSDAEFCFMYSKLKNFMLSYIYVDPTDLRKGHLSANNPFSEKKIEDFDAKTFLERLTKKIAKLEQCVHSQSEVLAQDESEQIKVKQQSAYSGLGLFAVADTNGLDESASINCCGAVESPELGNMPIKVNC